MKNERYLFSYPIILSLLIVIVLDLIGLRNGRLIDIIDSIKFFVMLTVAIFMLLIFLKLMFEEVGTFLSATFRGKIVMIAILIMFILRAVVQIRLAN